MDSVKVDGCNSNSSTMGMAYPRFGDMSRAGTAPNMHDSVCVYKGLISLPPCFALHTTRTLLDVENPQHVALAVGRRTTAALRPCPPHHTRLEQGACCVEPCSGAALCPRLNATGRRMLYSCSWPDYVNMHVNMSYVAQKCADTHLYIHAPIARAELSGRPAGESRSGRQRSESGRQRQQQPAASGGSGGGGSGCGSSSRRCSGSRNATMAAASARACRSQHLQPAVFAISFSPRELDFEITLLCPCRWGGGGGGGGGAGPYISPSLLH